MYAHLTTIKRATVIAALRHWQHTIKTGGNVRRDILDIEAAGSGGRTPLSVAEINDLCLELQATTDPVRSLLLDIRDVIEQCDPDHPDHIDSSSDLISALSALQSRILAAIAGTGLEGAPGAPSPMPRGTDDAWSDLQRSADGLIVSLKNAADQAYPVAALVLLPLQLSAETIASKVEALVNAVANEERDRG